MLFFWDQIKAEKFDVFSRVDALAEVIRRHIPTYVGRTAIRYDDGKAYRAISFADYSRALNADPVLRRVRVQGRGHVLQEPAGMGLRGPVHILHRQHPVPAGHQDERPGTATS